MIQNIICAWSFHYVLEPDSLLELTATTMAEGMVPELEAADLEEFVEATEATVLEAVEPAEGVPPAVRPKECPALGQGTVKGQEGLESVQRGMQD